MFKNREGTGRRELCCEQGGWGTGIGQGGRHSPYISSAPIREKPVRLRGGYVTALRANMFLGKEERTSKESERINSEKKKKPSSPSLRRQERNGLNTKECETHLRKVKTQGFHPWYTFAIHCRQG